MADQGSNASHADSSRALAPQETKAPGPRGIKEEIVRLATLGYYGIPVHISLKENGKKDTRFPKKYDHITTAQIWKDNIHDILDRFVDPNGIAILTGPSRLFVLDVDVGGDKLKQPGMGLWKTLVAQHGEPDTLKATSGTKGRHLYFCMDQTVGLKKLNNFSMVTVNKVNYGIDGRGVGGVIFAAPSAYIGANDTLLQYDWDAEPTQENRGDVKGIPEWLVDLVNNRGDGMSAENPRNNTKLSTKCAQSDDSNSMPNSEAHTSCGESTFDGLSSDFTHDSIAALEVRELLRKHSSNDATAIYGGSTTLPNGNRSFQFRVRSARTCYLGNKHNGSNNFTVIQGCAGDFQELYYRCFGTACSGQSTKLLGKLSIVAALEQVGRGEFGIRDGTVSCSSTLSLRLPHPFLGTMIGQSDWGAASIFAKLFEHDRRVVYDAGVFWIWNGMSWVQCDLDATEIKSAFMFHMGRVKAYWLEHHTTLCNEELDKAKLTKTAELERLQSAQETADSREAKRKAKDEEKAILKAFQQSKTNAEKSARWHGPDVESVPIASRCIVPLKRLLRVENFAKELNAARDFLNTTSGAIHLPTGKLIPHHPSNMLSKETATEYEGPNYPSPLIDEFMLQVQTEEIVPILQMTLGYGITGHSKEKQFIIMYGPSNSGKTRVVSLILGAIGLYGVTMDRDCVIGAGTRSEGAATPHLLKLEGAHIAILEETKEEEAYNAANLKSIASGDGAMTVRGLHMKPTEVTMRCLPIICTNALPKFNASDSGTLKKLRVFPFTREFVEKPQPSTNERLIDPDLVEKIKTPEWRKQMLAWLVRGSMAWYERGSLPAVKELPRDMQSALDGYVEANDHLNNFITDYCILREGVACHVDVLKKAYEDYIGRRDRPMIVTDFKVLMRGMKGVTYAKQIKLQGKNTTGYRGICLRSYANEALDSSLSTEDTS